MHYNYIRLVHQKLSIGSPNRGINLSHDSHTTIETVEGAVLAADVRFCEGLSWLVWELLGANCSQISEQGRAESSMVVCLCVFALWWKDNWSRVYPASWPTPMTLTFIRGYSHSNKYSIFKSSGIVFVLHCTAGVIPFFTMLSLFLFYSFLVLLIANFHVKQDSKIS